MARRSSPASRPLEPTRDPPSLEPGRAPPSRALEPAARRAEPGWLAPAIAAALLHLGIPLLAFLAPPGELAPGAREPIRAQDLFVVALEQVLPAPPASPPERPSADSAGEPAPTDRRAAKIAPSEAGARETTARAPEAVGPATPAPEGGPAPAPSTGGYDPLPADGRDIVFAPGVGGSPVWSLPGVLGPAERARPAPTTPGAAASVDRDVAGSVLRGTMRGKDKALGLDLPAAGTIASSVAEGVRGTDTPGVGRATFEVKVGPKGQVLSVRVLSASAGSMQAWQRAADLARTRLAGHKLSMTGEFAAGATVYVDISSLLQLPAGGTGGVIPEGPPPGSVGGGFAFDLSNIGAHATRVVKSSFRAVPSR